MHEQACPVWCAVRHGTQRGEEDWVHTSAGVDIADGLVARLCLSVEPGTGDRDGPYVLIGSTELTLAEARSLAGSLLALTDTP